MTVNSSIRSIFPELEEISDSALREAVERAWSIVLEMAGASSLDDTHLLTADLSSETGIEHQRGTVRLALAIADVLAAVHGAQLNRDHVIAGSLLHDAGKAVAWHERAENGAEAAPRHPFYAVHAAIQAGLPDAVSHIVAAHSLEGIYVKKTVECHVVSASDMLSADVLLRKHSDQTVFDFKRTVYLP